MWILFVLYVLLIFNLHTSICQNNPNNITINIIGTSKINKINLACQSSDTYTLLEGNAAMVIVNHHETINKAECYSVHNSDPYYTKDLEYHNKTTQTRIKITKVQAGEWFCVFSILRINSIVEPVNYKSKYIQVNCRFNIHVRLIYGPTISFNNVRVETKRQEVLTSEIDYVGYYYFRPGVTVNMKCFNPKGHFSAVGTVKQLELETVHSRSKSIEDGYGYIYAKLTKDYNNTYFNCIYSTMNDSLFVRVYMYISNRVIPAEDSLIIKINGICLKSNPILNATNNTTVNYLYYVITYSSDNELNITCEKKEDSLREIEFTLHSIGADYKNHISTRDNTAYKVIELNKVNNDSEIKCSLKTNQGTFMDYVIYFIKKWPTNGLLLNGLSSENILIDFENKSGLDHYIEYLYNDNDTLNLNCRWSKENCTITTIINGDNSSIINTNKATFTLDRSYNGTKIIFGKKYDDRIRTMINLVYQNDSMSNECTAKSNKDVSAKSHIILWSVISALIVVAVIVLIACRACVTRRKPQRPQLPLPESIEPVTTANTSQNSEEPEYEEILEAVPSQRPVNKLDLRRLYGMRLNPHTQVLYVHGNRIDLKRLQSNSEDVRAPQ